MKKIIIPNIFIPFGILVFMLASLSAASQKDSVTSEQVVKLKYFNQDNSIQYLILNCGMKTGKKIDPLLNKSFSIYLDSLSADNLIANVVTDKNGEAKSFIPPSLKPVWDAAATHNFIAQEKGKEETIELPITKSRVLIDTATADGARSITVKVEKFENDSWVPVNEVEMKVGYVRLGSILSAGDDPNYTTDSTGSVTVAVTKDSLPGDSKGNIMLAANIEDNESLGNVEAKKLVNWGVAFVAKTNFFDQRTLWTTRNRTPIWLLMIAYSIVLTVWATLIYLIFQLIKIRKMGRQATTG